MSDFEIEGICGGPFETNAYLITDPKTKKCASVDPGYDADRVWGPIISERGLELESILLTHGHIDHVTGVAVLSKAFPDVPILIHRDDVAMLGPINVQVAAMYGLPPYEPTEPTGILEEGKPIKVGETQFDVFHVPGHCPGHVMFLNGKHLIAGDVLFEGSIGRTDLPGGDYGVLAETIVKKLMTLPDETIVYPGHGNRTTIGRERAGNPFVLEMLAAAR